MSSHRPTWTAAPSDEPTSVIESFIERAGRDPDRVGGRRRLLVPSQTSVSVPRTGSPCLVRAGQRQSRP